MYIASIHVRMVVYYTHIPTHMCTYVSIIYGTIIFANIQVLIIMVKF